MVADLIQRLNIAHTFVHDLESTFWVLLWVTFAYMPNTWSDVDRSSFLRGTMSPRVNASNQHKVCPIISGLHWTNGLFLWVKVIHCELPFMRNPCCKNSPIESNSIAIAGI